MPGFDADFPTIRTARGNIEQATEALDRLGRGSSDSATAASKAAADDISTALGDLAMAIGKQSHEVRNVIDEIGRAVDKSAERYNDDDHDTGVDMSALEFGSVPGR